MTARIYRPAKTAMQSGRRKSSRWLLEYERQTPMHVDPLMGWQGSSDISGQVRLTFSSRAAAEEYARRHNLDYTLIDTPPGEGRSRRGVSYADNFRHDRKIPWTH